MSGGTLTFVLTIAFSATVFAKKPMGWGAEEPLCPPAEWGRTCDPENPEKCFIENDPAKLRKSFTIKHKSSKSDYVMICGHGMTESPYAMKDIAFCGAQLGIDVAAITLAGHDFAGPQSMKAASRDRWIRDFKCAIQDVKKRGKKPILCGSSTGGLIATRVAMELGIDNLLLFQPAVKLTRAPDYYINSPKAHSLGEKFNVKGSSGPVKVSYESIHRNVAQGIADTRRETEQIAEDIMESENKLPGQVFLYHSDGDWIIDAKKNRQFYRGVFQSVTTVETVSETPPKKGMVTSFFEKMILGAKPKEKPRVDREISTLGAQPHGSFLRPPDAKAAPVDQLVDKRFHHQNFSALCQQIQTHLRATVPGLESGANSSEPAQALYEQ